MGLRADALKMTPSKVLNTRLPSSTHRAESRVGECDSWDRDACRIRGHAGSGPTPYPAGRSSPKPRRLFRNCRVQDTASSRHPSSELDGNPAWRDGGALSLFFRHRHRTPLSFVGLEDLLAQPKTLRSDFDKLVVSDEFNGLLQIKIPEWHESNRDVRGGRPHVGQFLFADHIHVKIVVLGILANDHAFVNIDGGADKKLAALLQAVKGIRRGHARAIGNQRARQAMGNLALPFDVAIKKRIHDDGAASVGEQLAA